MPTQPPIPGWIIAVGETVRWLASLPSPVPTPVITFTITKELKDGADQHRPAGAREARGD